MTYKLFLDDYRIPPDVTWVQLPEGPWLIARNFQEFCDIIRDHGMPDFIAFDHDLADHHYWNDAAVEFTGYHCAMWLIEYCRANGHTLPAYAVHSMNPVGAARIKSIMGP